jgi:hypothetical protein
MVVSVNSSGREVRIRISGTSTVKVDTLRVEEVVGHSGSTNTGWYTWAWWWWVRCTYYGYGYMGIGGSQHALPHTGGGGGGSGWVDRDQHPGYNLLVTVVF